MLQVAVTDDFRTTPFWWEAAPLGPGPAPEAEVPARAAPA